ncbi:MAG: hypothetical protein HQL22_10480, partial [Candidatus Omnitrophica bacterium]|nr:hypothetical protein [Candidatus Omnitrophota bacterium]
MKSLQCYFLCLIVMLISGGLAVYAAGPAMAADYGDVRDSYTSQQSLY